MRVIAIALVVTCVIMQLKADEIGGRIQGVVTDASGSGVPNAEVKATNTQTQYAVTVSTQADGSFRFLSLPVGSYDVAVTKTGFRSFTARHITLLLNQVFSLPVALEIGQVTESVQVEANSAQVETSVTQLGTVIDAQNIVDLPLNGRNWTTLQQLSPGVVSASDRFVTYATNGSQSQQNAFLINGADSNDLPLNTPLIIPSPDAIGEFNLVTSTINPEYGRNSGGILNAIIKSGSNQLHGSAFEFYRDTFLNTHNFYQKTKPVFHQNQFGGTIGGPVWKDHTFFFLSYQGTEARQPQAGGQTTVFSQDERNGIFPDIGASTAVSPFPLVGENGATYAAGTPYRVIFPSGRIPARDVNPISQKLLGFIPLPNSPGNLFSFNPTTTRTQKQGIARIDHTFNQRDAVWLSMIFENSPTSDTLPFTGSTLPGFGDVNQRSYKIFTADWTHTLTPTTLNELRLSYVRFNYVAISPQTPVLPSSVGFAGINPQNTSGSGIPFVSLAGLFDLGFSINGPQPRIDQTYQLTDNFSKVIGSHTLKFGFDGKRYQVTNPFYGNNNGNFAFGGSGNYSTGNPGADFLLGIPDSYAQGSGGFIDARTYEYYFYAQDSWKVSNNLTLNYGTGYQIDTPLVNQHFDRLAKNCFRPGEQSTVFPTAPVGLVFPGDKGCSESGYYTHYLHFGPRFGFAYSPNAGSLSGGNGAHKFVIRGGFGIYFNRSEEELALQDIGAVPFSVSSAGIGDIGGSPSFGNPFVDISTGQRLANKFPFTPAAKGSTVDFSQFLPLSINVINPNFTSPYTMNFNLNVQRELPGAMVLQIGYVGAQARHLVVAYEGNPITLAGAAQCAADPKCISNRTNQHVLYPSHAAYAPGDIFASVGTQATVGVSNYNSLQASLTKRLTRGLTFTAAYTYSHSIDDGSGFEDSSFGVRGWNPYNARLNRGDSSFDARHRFVSSYDYELPHLARYWNNGLVRHGLDGWRVAGITTFQTGFPINFSDAGFRSLTCDTLSYYGCPDAPNSIGPLTSLDPRNAVEVNKIRNAANSTALPYYWFNPNQFTRQAFGTFGTAGRNAFHGPGVFNTDLSLDKEFIFNEHRKIQLRLEAFNVFNHTQFGTATNFVSGDANSANFGRVLAAAPGRIVQLGAKFYF